MEQAREPLNDFGLAAVDDAELVRRALARDGGAFRAIMKKYIAANSRP